MSSSTIPTIHCAAICKGDFNDFCSKDFKRVAQALGQAMPGIGMCNVINHSVDAKKVNTRVHNKVYFIENSLLFPIQQTIVSTNFFELPVKIKL